MTAIKATLAPRPSRAIIAAHSENEEEADALFNLALSRSQAENTALAE